MPAQGMPCRDLRFLRHQQAPCSEGLADELEVFGEAQVVSAEREVVLARAAPETHHHHSETLALVPGVGG